MSYVNLSLKRGVAVAITLLVAGYFFNPLSFLSQGTSSRISSEVSSDFEKAPSIVSNRPTRETYAVFFNNHSVDTFEKNGCDVVFPSARPLKSSDMPGKEIELLLSLLRGPSEEEARAGLSSPFSELTASALLSVNFREGVAAVNLADVRTLSSSDGEPSCIARSVKASIEATLSQFEGVDHIVFAINGDPNLFYDWARLSCDVEGKSCNDFFR